MRGNTAVLIAGLSLGCASGGYVDGSPAAPAVGEIEVTLLLVGDAGWAKADDPVLGRVTAHASERPDRTVVVFLGDNVYQDGLAAVGSPDRERGERILKAQLRVGGKSGAGAGAGAGARLVFVPGNHDWDRSGPDGWEDVLRQGRFLASNGAELLPAGGCPGPSVVDVGSQVRIVALDTQWWLHGEAKPQDPTSECGVDSEIEILDALGVALEAADSRQVVVVAHHPLASAGKHAGHFGWKDHIFPLRNVAKWMWLPLPIIGSAYPLVRRLGATAQDMSGSANRHMRQALDSVFAIYRPLVYASGHDHSLQVLEGETARYFLVSGASTIGHFSAVGREDRTRYSRAATGFMRLDFTTDRRVRLGVFTVDKRGTETEEYSVWLDTR
ncbi:MAG: metallophosphoesterase [Gemmatimonadetes bacterium]|nr:metallophosphoesterase [Gemmatimonadota bacterium]